MNPPPPPAPGFAEALKVWLRIGFLSFGGPAGQIALMHRVLVEERRWISEPRYLHAVNFTMLLPGPEAMQLATYVGWTLHGVRGGLAAGLCFILPGFLVLTALSIAYALFQAAAPLETLFFGLKAAVLAIIAQAFWKIGRKSLRGRFALALCAAAFIALFAFNAPFPAVIAGAALAGLAAGRWRPGWLPAADADEAALDQPPVRSGHGLRALRVIALGLVIWAAPVLALAAAGTGGDFIAIAAFFSKLAVVSFGGAYAVLAYVAQDAVLVHGWLAPGEMLDGLALAETTPGPLVLVLVFVGFLAGFRESGMLDALSGGLLGAFLTGWVTFVPCFLWIFLGAPYVEALRRVRALAAALSAILAAVAGVILNLSVWFALHVLFADVQRIEAGPLRIALPGWESFDPGAALLVLAALFAVFRLKAGIAVTLGGCALIGALIHTRLLGLV